MSSIIDSEKFSLLMTKLQEPANLALLIVSVITFLFILRKSFDSGEGDLDIPEPTHPDSVTFSEYNLSELRDFDGTGPTKLIFIGIKEKVYDVSSKPEFYGPNGAYGVFAGRDATAALAKSDITTEFIPKVEDKPHDLTTLSEKEKETLDGWVSFFDNKYQVVGTLKY
ncbi:hypothetical protein BB560_005162 [Smittium megazygosporum]|uniref:Cytochrome b5 heme-binding domain-containing protein n=1 Tax=Smittium megazygosporum TaxID=133381 RepID=A0A2T9Z778_9FUNG|nr:hypothetical protein BB560_005162 [Smittium megazygosporum]